MTTVRKAYEAAFAPVGKLIARTGISPNTITTLGAFIAVLSAVSYSLGGPWGLFLGVIFLLGAVLVDMMDGSVARANGETQPFGMVLDHVTDRYTEFLFLLGILIGGFVYPEWILFTFTGMLMASYVRAKAENAGLENCSVGIAERKEKITIIAIGSFLEIPYQMEMLQQLWLPSFPLVFGPLGAAILFVGIISNISAFQRLRFAQKNLPTKTASISSD